MIDHVIELGESKSEDIMGVIKSGKVNKLEVTVRRKNLWIQEMLEKWKERREDLEDSV